MTMSRDHARSMAVPASQENRPARLQVQGLVKRFGGHVAVHDVQFDVSAGELVALIGPNGAGKSTTFNLINGQLEADAGDVRYEGRAITGMPPPALARLGIARTFQIAATFSSFSVLQNVQMAVAARQGAWRRWWRPLGSDGADEAHALLAQVGLAGQAERRSHELAYGDVKRVELAMALAGEPRLLLMDEPAAGMAPAERRALVALVRQLVAERDLAVLFTEHSMDVVFDYADRILVMAGGRLIAHGDAGTVRADPAVQAVYFGTGRTFEAVPPVRENLAGPVAPASASDPVSVAQPPLLAVQALNAWYGAAQALFDVDLAVQPGEVVALMGRNGAGKSTALKSLMGLVTRQAQTLSFLGSGMGRLAPHQVARLGLGYVPEDRRVFSELTVLQNLETGRQPPRLRQDGQRAPFWDEEAIFALFPLLQPLRHRVAGRLSGGEQQMLAVARALMGQPWLMLLDEPSEGVAPVVVEQMADMILALKAHGVGVLLCEQNLQFTRLVADRAYVLEKGAIRAEGEAAVLLEDRDLLSKYLAI